jgi:putative ABC transport system ATP-binding protein
MQETALSLLVDLQHITKIYHSGQAEYPILKEVNFSLSKGEMVAIMGASGSGKSSLMNVIGLLDRSMQGKYYLSGNDVSLLSDEELSHIRNQKIGFVFQAFFLLPRFDVLQNVMLPLYYCKKSESSAKQKALSVLRKVGMDHYLHHKPNQLSGGQQQRVAIARALVNGPDIILADEPTGSLDSVTGQDIMSLFLSLNVDEKRTIVLVTHDKEVAKRCQRTVIIKDGKVFL